MIVSVSYRTDIPAFYADWFLARLAAGACMVANPYGGPAYRVALSGPEAEGFVFWTRNVAPFRQALEAVAARGLPFVVQYTITGYPRALEPSVIAAERSVALVRELANRYGPRAVVWRYDPLFITSVTPPAWHRETFAGLAAALAGATDEVVLSFAHVYRKTRVNTERAARRHGFTWRDPGAGEKRALLAELAGLARSHGLRASLCAQPELLGGGLEGARCIDAGRLSDLAGRAIEAETKGNRPGCLCARSRDLGAYDTCPHGCVYCYAVSRPQLAKRRHRAHDPARDRLAG
jgi:hypothetical protein